MRTFYSLFPTADDVKQREWFQSLPVFLQAWVGIFLDSVHGDSDVWDTPELLQRPLSVTLVSLSLAMIVTGIVHIMLLGVVSKEAVFGAFGGSLVVIVAVLFFIPPFMHIWLRAADAVGLHQIVGWDWEVGSLQESLALMSGASTVPALLAPIPVIGLLSIPIYLRQVKQGVQVIHAGDYREDSFFFRGRMLLLRGFVLSIILPLFIAAIAIMTLSVSPVLVLLGG